MKQIILFLTIFCCSVLSLRAQSQTISYQGVISDAAGLPVDGGTYFVTVTFYSDESGTHSLWQDSFETTVTKGVFNIALGSGRALPKPTEMDRTIWVGTSIGGTELRPLTKLGAVPMAMNVTDNSITAKKLAVDYVSAITVNGVQATGKGTPLNITTGDGLNATFDPGSNSLLLSAGSGKGTNAKGDATQSALGTDYWGEIGNISISVPTNFIGTSDNSPAFEIHLEDSGSHEPRKRVYHVELGTKISPNIVMGYGSGETGPTTGNFISGQGSVILGGGFSGSTNTNYIDGNFSVIGGGRGNKNYSDSSVIVGGTPNLISENSYWGFIGGGSQNWIYSQSIGASIVGGKSNFISNPLSAIVGGRGNHIADDLAIQDADDSGSFIGGGIENLITEGYDVITGGRANSLNNLYSTIGGGKYNRSEFPSSFIGGGDSNLILGISTLHDSLGIGHSIIGGGRFNRILSAVYSTIAGGAENVIDGTADFTSDSYSFIGGGFRNVDSGIYSVMGGGENNTINADCRWSSIVGGRSNSIYREFAAPVPAYNIIGGGTGNSLGGAWSFIGSGEGNSSTGDRSGIVGGEDNHILGSAADLSFIGGGESNNINATHSVIGGGQNNLNNGPWCVIGGGDSNQIIDPEATLDVIGGGYGNIMRTPSLGTIGGGESNELDTASWGSTIAGGSWNVIGSPLGFIGGGRFNEVRTSWNYSSGIACGQSNFLQSTFSFIGGGLNNHTNSDWSVIAGGDSNTILGSDSARGAAIPGGIGLTARSYTQFVAGRFNVPEGSSKAGAINYDDPLAIFGNGTDAAHQSDAVTIKNGGYVTASGQAGTGGGMMIPPTGNNGAIMVGSTHIDNTIDFWGNVAATAPGGTPLAGGTLADAGVTSVVFTPPNTYLVTLNLLKQDGTAFTCTLNSGAITVSCTNNALAGGAIATVTPITAGVGTFTVQTWSAMGVADATIGFQFHGIVR